MRKGKTVDLQDQANANRSLDRVEADLIDDDG